MQFAFAEQTLVDWSSYCREVAIDAVFKHSEKIGGPVKIVEIDESKFGKSKLLYLIFTYINLLKPCY